MISAEVLKQKIFEKEYNNFSSFKSLKLGEIIDINFGVRITKKDDLGTKYPVYGGGGTSFLTDSYNRENDYIISRFAMSKDCVRYINGPFFALDSSFTFSIKDNFFEAVYKNFIGTFLFNNNNAIFSCGRGQAQINIDIEKFQNIIINIPPLKEQKKMVAKIDEFFRLINILKKNDIELVQLERLLKNKLFDNAICGRLVKQEIVGINAKVTINNIKEKQGKLISNKFLKKDSKINSIKPEEKLPIGWEWARLGDLGIYKKGPFGSSLTKNMFISDNASAIKVYEQKNAIQKNAAIGNYFISEAKFNKMTAFEVKPGNIIVSCAGTIGETFVLPENSRRGIINQALMKIELFDNSYLDYYLMYFDYVLKKDARKKGKGTAIVNIPPFEILKNIYIPFPPLEEQKRIIFKITKIFDLISNLQ